MGLRGAAVNFEAGLKGRYWPCAPQSLRTMGLSFYLAVLLIEPSLLHRPAGRWAHVEKGERGGAVVEVSGKGVRRACALGVKVHRLLGGAAANMHLRSVKGRVSFCQLPLALGFQLHFHMLSRT